MCDNNRCGNAIICALNQLNDQPFKQLVDFTKFTLYSEWATTKLDHTEIVTIPEHFWELIHFISRPEFRYIAPCSLTGFSFLLTDEAEVNAFIERIREDSPYWKCSMNHCGREECCCIQGKANALYTAKSNINIGVAGTLGELLDGTILLVTEGAVWIKKTVTIGEALRTRFYVVCLEYVEFISE